MCLYTPLCSQPGRYYTSILRWEYKVCAFTSAHKALVTASVSQMQMHDGASRSLPCVPSNYLARGHARGWTALARLESRSSRATSGLMLYINRSLPCSAADVPTPCREQGVLESCLCPARGEHDSRVHGSKQHPLHRAFVGLRPSPDIVTRSNAHPVVAGAAICYRCWK